MIPPHHSSIEAYIRGVLSYIPRTFADRLRIEEDLRAHLTERMEAGDSVMAAITAMGDPKEVAASYLGERPVHYAPLGRRLAAAIIDYALLSIAMSIIVAVPLGIILALGPWGDSQESLTCTVDIIVPFVVSTSSTCPSEAWAIALAITAIGFSVAGSMMYFPIAEAVFGQTIGKQLLGLAVITESGLAIGAKEAIIRRLPYLFQGAIILDAIFVFIGQKHQRAFDRVAGTIVVRTSGLTGS